MAGGRASRNDPAMTGPGLVSIARIAADCVKAVRHVHEREDEAVELILRIWDAAARQVSRDLDVGRCISLMPLGLFYRKPVAEGARAMVPHLELSLSYQATYGISVEEQGMPRSAGPSMRLNHVGVARVAEVDRGLVPGVLAAIFHRMGEAMGQGMRVKIDFAPLGEIFCEGRLADWRTVTRAVPPTTTNERRASVGGVMAQAEHMTSPKLRKVKRLSVQQAKIEEDNEILPSELLDGPGVQIAMESSIVAMHQMRAQHEEGPQLTLSPRHPKTFTPQPPGTPDLVVAKYAARDGAATMESWQLMAGSFHRSMPNHDMRFPPILDELSRTLAAPYGEELFRGSTSGRIASHYSPVAALLALDLHSSTALAWRVDAVKNQLASAANSTAHAATQIEVDYDEIFHDQRIEEGSPIDEELIEAGVSVKQFYECLHRYSYYVTHGVADRFIAPMNQAWVDNVGYLLEAERFIAELTNAKVDEMLSDMHQEMVEDYLEASRKTISDYIFKDARIRTHAHILFVPCPTISWGSVPFEGIEGTFGGPPDSWRAGMEESRIRVVQELTICNQSSLRLLALWHRVYDILLLNDLPSKAASGLQEIDRFFGAQSSHREEVYKRFEQQWLEEVAAILRDEKKENDGFLNARTEPKFFEAVSTLLSTQLRSVVERSIDAYVDFFQRFARESPMTPEEVISLRDTDEREDAFLVIKLTARHDEIRFKSPLDQVSEKILRVFYDFVICLKDMPRPEVKLNRNRGQARANLWEVSLDEQYVEQAKRFVDQVVRLNLANVEKALRLYDDYVHLLSEEHRTREFAEDLSHTRKEYLAQVERLRATERAIRKSCPNQIRMQMVSVDCAEINETLCTKANECVAILLQAITDRNRDRNHRLVKDFESVVNKINKKPTSEEELVDLEATVDQFRMVDLKNLLDEYHDIRAWQQLLFDCAQLLKREDFSAIKSSAYWVQTIDSTVDAREADLKQEREALENKFKEQRNKFSEDLMEYLKRVNQFKECGNMRQMDDYIERINALKEKFERSKADAEKLNKKEEMLGWEPTEFEQLYQGIEKLEPYDKLWSLAKNFEESSRQWTRGPLFSLDPEQVDKEANEMWRTASRLQQTFENGSETQPAGVAQHIKTELDQHVKSNLSLVHALCNPGLRTRHWEMISGIVGFAMEPDNSFTLSRVINMEVGRYMEQLQEISEAAAKEYSIEKSLGAMHSEWQPMTIDLKKWRDTGTFILQGNSVEEMQSLMDDHIVKTKTMKGSPFARPFEKQIAEWEGWLILTQEILDLWLKVQGVWLYLEPIFTCEDIMKQMPTEGQLFKKVDQAWRAMMSMANEQRQALQVTKQEGLLESLKECGENLETVQKGLNDYLETKRLTFPRFFFLSNDELLEILSETRDPLRVQPHLKKCFEGIQSLRFSQDKKITAMISSEKEVVEFENHIDPSLSKGNVEVWLVEVQHTMLTSIRSQCFEAIRDHPERPRTAWVQDWPGQAVLCADNVFWTQEVTAAIRNDGVNGLAEYHLRLEDQLERIVELIRQDLAPIVRKTLEALVVIDVHNKDVVEELAEAEVDSEDSFDWLVQLRYYVEEQSGDGEEEQEITQDIFARITNAHLGYNYEYLGNSSRLVITPLTDRCYRTLCGALHLLYGGAPEGPAGTGKTETTKDLAKALARMCVVFNCSDSLDVLAMSKFFKGLASSGAWCCFDEFNRIDLEVLSVIAQQILTIQQAIAKRLTHFDFEGTSLPLKWTCNCFITMNPGYAGRSDLPDNLKALFRTVAMMIPDYAMIAEIKLYSFGFTDSRNLARKIVSTYKLCSEQLSSQHHYDYGMRAVFTVLVAAGNLKRRFVDEDESVLTLRAINDVNMAKFLQNDLPLFLGITSDLFPNITLPKPDYSGLLTALDTALEGQGLQQHEYLQLKTVQLYEMVIVRHGLMTVGKPYGGKTTSIKSLSAAVTDLAGRNMMDENRVDLATLNPKSIKLGQLYGCFDEVSREWSDGVLAVLFRNFAKDASTTRKWLHFDGPVDAVWIENMNTVLDDNRKLCLMSGEIIQMSQNMNLIFEPQDLAVASPATVSRCGMVYYEPSEMGYKHLMTSWMQQRCPKVFEDNERAEMTAMIDWLVPPLLDVVRTQCAEVSPTQDQNLVQSLLCILEYIVQPLTDSDTITNLGSKAILGHIDAYVVLSVIWAIGAVTTTDTRKDFDGHLQKLLNNQQPDVRAFKKLSPSFPEKGTCFDHAWNKDTGAWCSWIELQYPEGNQVFPNKMHPSEIIVRTLDTARYTYFAKVHCETGTHVLFCGPTGTGKTAYMKEALHSLDTDTYQSIEVFFSAQADANQTQDMIDAKLDKRRRDTYGPPMGKKCAIFVDDLNMPQKERYGAQPPVELLRQFCDWGGWYERKDNTHPFRNILDCFLLAAMGPPGGGRTSISMRMLRHFHLVGFTQLDNENMTKIFATIISWKFQVEGFPPEVQNLSKTLVSATLDVYKGVATELLPTPSKSHYTFNLRDFSRVIMGILMLGSNEVDGQEKHTRLWIHEVFRVFGDRLIDDTDRLTMLDIVRTCTLNRFGTPFDAILEHLDKNGDGKVNTLDEVRGLFFGDMISYVGAPTRPYDEIQNYDLMQERIEQALQQMNNLQKTQMNLVMFSFAVEHVSRIARILKSLRGSALLVGVGGSGRQSLTRLASYMADNDVFQIAITKNYNRNTWRDDLKRLLEQCGAKGDRVSFLFTDTQIKDECFVEDINSMLNTGEVPNIWTVEEKITIQEAVRPHLKQVNTSGSGANGAQLYQFFVERCRKHLHVLLCFSPIGNSLRSRVRQFPSLVNCCTIDWFSEWPEDALRSVATNFLGEVDLPSETRASCVEICQHFHSSTTQQAKHFLKELGRHYYTTPTSYLELIYTFKSVLGDKRKEVLGLQQRYTIGLEKLKTTEDSVEGMQEHLTQLKPKLIQKGGEVKEMMVVVQEETQNTEKVRLAAKAKEAAATEVADRAGAIKEECEGELAQAMPALRDANAALNTLSSQDIAEIRGMSRPSAPVKKVLEAVCVLKGIGPKRVKDETDTKMVNDFWSPSQKMIAATDFLQSLMKFDKDNIPPETIKKISRYIQDEDFEPAKVQRVSKAAYGLCCWVRAMEMYDRVAKNVKPKKEALAVAEGEYNEVMAKLNDERSELAKVEASLEALNKKLVAMQEDKATLEAQVDDCTKKLDRAEKLISSLGGEKTRWEEKVERLGHDLVYLTGNVLVASGMIAYLGAFTPHYRVEATSSWDALCKTLKIPGSAKFSLSEILGEPVKIRAWIIDGLPNDAFSIDNGIIVTRARRWPLCIDPQGQANKWIKRMEQPHRLMVLKFADPSDHKKLEGAVQFGHPALVEDVGEELEPTLEPVLLKQVFKQGGITMIQFGDAAIEYNDAFRFYLTTKLRNPHYMPETAVKVTLLNFMITPDALEDQLLGLVVAIEKPELEEEKNQLILESAENQRELEEIEDKILKVLSSSSGNLLDDESAIQVLSASKSLSDEIAEKQRVAEETEVRIDEARLGYHPVAGHACVLFFCVARLGSIDPMYQYSLSFFIQLFSNSISQSKQSEELPQRISNISNEFTLTLYRNICRSLFARHKLLFSTMLAVDLALANPTTAGFDMGEYKFLLAGGVGLIEHLAKKPADWIEDRSWSELHHLEKLPNFANLIKKFQDDLIEWKALYDSETPHTAEAPLSCRHLNAFQFLLILRCLRPDKVLPAVTDWISSKMGNDFVHPPPFDLAGSFADSTPTTPLIFILSPGSDPLAAVLRFAEQRQREVRSVSLGQGQGPRAEVLIDEAAQRGNWAMLQNCHLAASWMPSLEYLVEKLNPESIHRDFRLWLTSYPSTYFPVGVLQDGVKMTNEPPQGIRGNLQSLFLTDPISDPEFFQGSPDHEREFKTLLYCLLFFHTVIQERRSYGPLGWNIPYEFTQSDLQISARQLQMYLNEYPDTVPFKALLYLTGECNYGGRVTEAQDRRLLSTLLADFYTELVFEPNYSLCPNSPDKPEAYLIPQPMEYEGYLDFVNSLPSISPPEVCGFHANAAITRDQQATFDLCGAILQSLGSGGPGGLAGDMETATTVATDILKKMPEAWNVALVQKKYPLVYEESMNTVLCQELLRYNVLIDVVISSLQDVLKGIKGQLVMSAELEATYHSLSVGKIPDMWADKSYPSLKPLGSYVVDLVERLEFFQLWIDGGAPKKFWFSGFYFTQSFLTGLMQNYVRKYGLAIDGVQFDFEIVEEGPVERPPDGAVTHGLFLEGCSWDQSKVELDEPSPKVLFVPCPMIWFRPCEISNLRKFPNYECPVYKVSSRRGTLSTTGHSTNFVLGIRMPTSMDPGHWMKRGVAALTQLDS